jgi:outer membrane protein TolC
LDVQQATANLANTRSLIPLLEQGVLESKNQLSILLGRPPGAIDQMLGAAGNMPYPDGMVAIGLPTDLLRRRPDIRAAEARALAQCLRIGIAETDLLPHFSLFGSIGVRANNASNLFDGNAVTSAGGPGISWDIFNYGQISNNVRTQDARLQQLLVNYQNVVLQAAQEVEDSTVGFVRTQEQERYLNESVKAALRSVDLAVIQYRDGAVDYTRVLNTQQSLILQQDQATVTRGEIAQNLVGMYRALGGGWQLRAGKDFIPEATKDVMSKRTNWGNVLTPEDQETLMPPSTTPDDSYRWPRW